MKNEFFSVSELHLYCFPGSQSSTNVIENLKLKRDSELMASALTAESSGNSDDDYEDPGYIKPNFYPDLKPHLVRCSSDSSAHPRSKMRKLKLLLHLCTSTDTVLLRMDHI